jgi:hypothetical protein
MADFDRRSHPGCPRNEPDQLRQKNPRSLKLARVSVLLWNLPEYFVVPGAGIEPARLAAADIAFRDALMGLQEDFVKAVAALIREYL